MKDWLSNIPVNIHCFWHRLIKCLLLQFIAIFVLLTVPLIRHMTSRILIPTRFSPLQWWHSGMLRTERIPPEKCSLRFWKFEELSDLVLHLVIIHIAIFVTRYGVILVSCYYYVLVFITLKILLNFIWFNQVINSLIIYFSNAQKSRS